MIQIWEALEEVGGRNVSPPFWAVAWVGGQALARYVLDRPQVVIGKRVLDLGAGSGLCAIAACKAGALAVEASERDHCGRIAIEMNAALNAVTLSTNDVDLVGDDRQWDVVLAADLWYERLLADRLTPWLRQLAAKGCEVLLGDLGRAYFPRVGVQELARYQIPTPETLERGKITEAAAWRLLP